MMLAAPRLLSAAPTPPDRVAPVIETFLRWAIEGGTCRPIRRSRPRFSPIGVAAGDSIRRIFPETVYVSWQLSAEAQHAACNWKYDVASHTASPLTRRKRRRSRADLRGDRRSAGARVLPFGAATRRPNRRDGGVLLGLGQGTFAFRAEGRS